MSGGTEVDGIFLSFLVERKCSPSLSQTSFLLGKQLGNLLGRTKGQTSVCLEVKVSRRASCWSMRGRVPQWGPGAAESPSLCPTHSPCAIAWEDFVLLKAHCPSPEVRTRLKYNNQLPHINHLLSRKWSQTLESLWLLGEFVVSFPVSKQKQSVKGVEH